MIAVTLTPTTIEVNVGQQKNLSCTTSFCFPKANITWFMSSRDIISQSTSTIDEPSGLVRTNSSLLLTFLKSDNGNQVYCEASNKPNLSVKSGTYAITVLCKYLTSSMYYIKRDLL